MTSEKKVYTKPVILAVTKQSENYMPCQVKSGGPYATMCRC